MRNVDGQMPLHCAVRRSFARITKVVLDASKSIPSSSSSSSSSNSSSCVVTTTMTTTTATLQTYLLNIKDSVGLTPLEIARLQELRQRVSMYTHRETVHRYAAAGVDPRRVDVVAGGGNDRARDNEKEEKGHGESVGGSQGRACALEDEELQGGKGKRKLNKGRLTKKPNERASTVGDRLEEPFHWIKSKEMARQRRLRRNFTG
ncbi:hypothetical protein CVT25_007324 [Psilocybe cyanescens]|uniref:Uncharacterized protein n=1 Tax=Psilocybe cyanescens TaxID=93625 RepID=A0A409VXP4_PSICY|nr:hypothetical protein CVT25_007324 [Psilocybe cyanescens]